MRYELDGNGYICKAFFGCHSGTCTLYEGEVPTGYTTLEEWATTANIRAYKLEEGNLVYDETRNAELTAEWEVCASGKNIVTAKLDANTTMLATGTYQKLNLIEHTRAGNKLSLLLGDIKIGAGVSLVKVSFHVHYNSVTASGQKWATLCVNGNAEVPISVYLTNKSTITSGEVMLPVKEGDTIDLQVNGTKGDVVRNGLYTALTVETVG
jgi:hypothetical protein